MGVSMSITKTAKYSKPKYANLGTPGADGEGADGQDAEAAAAAEPVLELNSETIDKIKQANFDKWSELFRNLIRNKDIETKIRSSYNDLFLNKLKGLNNSSKSDSGDAQTGGAEPGEDGAATTTSTDSIDINNFNLFYADYKIVASKDNVFEYLGGDAKFSFFLKEDIDKYWLVDEKVKELINEETVNLIIELGKNKKKFKEENKEKYNELSDIVTKITEKIVPIMFDKTQLAVQHKELKDIVMYVLDSDELKKMHKEENISGSKGSILSGKTTAKEAAMEKREKNAADKEQKAAEEAAESGEKVGGNGDITGVGKGDEKGAEESGADTSELEDTDSDSEPEPDTDTDSSGAEEDTDLEEEEEEEEEEGGGNIDGGKSSKEKQYNKFKKEERKDFAEKKDNFAKDEVKMIAFLDANATFIMRNYEKNKIGINMKKSGLDTNTDLLNALITAVNSYEKELETTGAAVEMIAKSAEGAAAAPEGAAGAPAEAAAAPAAAAETPAAAAETPAAAAETPAKPEGGAAPPLQGGGGGGGNTTTKSKKKRHPKKLPKNINININLGKTNIAYDNDYDDDTSSGTSSSSSSSSDSESEDEKHGKIIKKGKKQVKYVVNATKKKSRTKRRRQDNDSE